jgi:hypothetical protein
MRSSTIPRGDISAGRIDGRPSAIEQEFMRGLVLLVPVRSIPDAWGRRAALDFDAASRRLNCVGEVPTRHGCGKAASSAD